MITILILQTLPQIYIFIDKHYTHLNKTMSIMHIITYPNPQNSHTMELLYI